MSPIRCCAQQQSTSRVDGGILSVSIARMTGHSAAQQDSRSQVPEQVHCKASMLQHLS